tara:strand:- start:1785 stop:2150 length:366 start_codon:yes stop_codon:yes gene_type:complete
MIASLDEKHRWSFHYAHGKAEELLPEDIFFCSEPMPKWGHPLLRDHPTYAAECHFKDSEGNLHKAIILTCTRQEYNMTGGYLLLFGDQKGITEVMQYEEFNFFTDDEKQVTIDYISNNAEE